MQVVEVCSFHLLLHPCPEWFRNRPSLQFEALLYLLIKCQYQHYEAILNVQISHYAILPAMLLQHFWSRGCEHVIRATSSKRSAGHENELHRNLSWVWRRMKDAETILEGKLYISISSQKLHATDLRDGPNYRCVICVKRLRPFARRPEEWRDASFSSCENSSWSTHLQAPRLILGCHLNVSHVSGRTFLVVHNARKPHYVPHNHAVGQSLPCWPTLCSTCRFGKPLWSMFPTWESQVTLMLAFSTDMDITLPQGQWGNPMLCPLMWFT